MFDLIRIFKTREEAEEFVKGTIRLNTLDFYFNHGLEDPGIAYEGAVAPIKISFGGEMPPEEKLTPAYRTVEDKEVEEVKYRLDSVRYCNILSMIKHGYDRNTWTVEELPEKIREYGEYAVIVSNLEVFVSKLYQALKELSGAYGIMGPVVYHDDIARNYDYDLFDRSRAFEWQKEWRLVILKKMPGFEKLLEAHPDLEYEIPITLEIGDISELAEIVSTKILVRQPAAIYKGFKKVKKYEPDMQARLLRKNGIAIPYDTYCEQYVGFTPRRAFLGKVIEVDQAKVREL